MQKNSEERSIVQSSRRALEGSAEHSTVAWLGSIWGANVTGCALRRSTEAAREVADFGATTPELIRLAQWLKQRNVESVAMESTGVYWIAPHEVLEAAGLRDPAGGHAATGAGTGSGQEKRSDRL